jgi:hypothetical protein
MMVISNTGDFGQYLLTLERKRRYVMKVSHAKDCFWEYHKMNSKKKYVEKL